MEECFKTYIQVSYLILIICGFVTFLLSTILIIKEKTLLSNIKDEYATYIFLIIFNLFKVIYSIFRIKNVELYCKICILFDFILTGGQGCEISFISMNDALL